MVCPTWRATKTAAESPVFFFVFITVAVAAITSPVHAMNSISAGLDKFIDKWFVEAPPGLWTLVTAAQGPERR